MFFGCRSLFSFTKTVELMSCYELEKLQQNMKTMLSLCAKLWYTTLKYFLLWLCCWCSQQIL